jgi:TPR repeat protein
MKYARGIFSIPFILLIILIILFHNELFAIGIRIYVSFKPDAYAERLLGNFYETSAHQNMMLANQFYSKAFTGLKEQVLTAPEANQAALKYRIGVFYECGRGIPKDYIQAKKSYDEALLASNKTPGDTALQESIKASVDRADKLLKNQASPLCPEINDIDFIRNSFNGVEY